MESGIPIFPQPLRIDVRNQLNANSLFTADSGRIVAVRLDGSVGVWDLRTGLEIRSIRSRATPHTFAIHPDGRQVALCFAESAVGVEIWNVESGSKLTELSTSDGRFVCSLAWHPDGRRLAMGFKTPTGRVQVWDVADRRALAALEGHVEDVTAMSFHPGGDLMVTVSHDGTFRLWDAATARQLVNWPSTSIRDIHFSRGGDVCGFVLLDGQARLMEVADGGEYRTIVSSLGAGRGAYGQGGISSDGLLAVGMLDGTRLWELATGREIAHLPDELIDSVNFVSRPEGTELLTRGPGGLRRWPLRRDAQRPELLRIGPPIEIPLPIVPTRADVDREGRLAAVASERSGTAVIVDLATGTVSCTLAPHPSHAYIASSPDGRLVATSGWHSSERPRFRHAHRHTGQNAGPGPHDANLLHAGQSDPGDQPR